LTTKSVIKQNHFNFILFDLYDYKVACRLLLNPFFWIVNPIQIYKKYVIDDPNLLFKMDGQSSNPIQQYPGGF